jgi:hypothetical protein
MVERFNGRIGDVIAQTRFHSALELEQTLLNYVKAYNCRIQQRALGHLCPMQCLKTWYSKAPSLFNKQPNDLPGLDKRRRASDPGRRGQRHRHRRHLRQSRHSRSAAEQPDDLRAPPGRAWAA